MRYIIDKLILYGSIIVGLMGGADIMLRSLVIVMVLDYVTGVLSAIYKKELSSKIGIKGIAKKLSYLGVVMLACVLDNLTGNTNIIRTLVIYFFVANDGLSIVENLAEMNIKLPNKIKEVLKQLKKESKDGE